MNGKRLRVHRSYLTQHLLLLLPEAQELPLQMCEFFLGSLFPERVAHDELRLQISIVHKGLFPVQEFPLI